MFHFRVLMVPLMKINNSHNPSHLYVLYSYVVCKLSRVLCKVILSHNVFNYVCFNLYNNMNINISVRERQFSLYNVSVANLNLKDSQGNSPLCLALSTGMQHLIPDLIEGKEK